MKLDEGHLLCTDPKFSPSLSEPHHLPFATSLECMTAVSRLCMIASLTERSARKDCGRKVFGKHVRRYTLRDHGLMKSAAEATDEITCDGPKIRTLNIQPLQQVQNRHSSFVDIFRLKRRQHGLRREICATEHPQ